MNHIWAVFKARIKEFYRERTGLYWSFLMPLLIVLGLSFVFSKDQKDTFEVALIATSSRALEGNVFFQWDQLHFISMEQLEAEEKLARHKVDIAIRLDDTLNYWINSTSKNGQLLERLLRAESNRPIVKNTITVPEVAYIDWVLPGILGMNIMFNCLWGIGFIIVKYRDNGFLKRLKATPLKAYEYLLAQVLARYLIGFT
ncbi:ABC transporter permease, partial [Pseudomonadota bacterium]